MRVFALCLVLISIQTSKGTVELRVSISTLCSGMFTCSAVNLPDTTLRWFFDNRLIASYPFAHGDSYPRPVTALNATYNARVGGVNVQMLEASLNENNRDSASFLSTLMANILALQQNGVSAVSCGSFAVRNISLVSVERAPQPLLTCSVLNIETHRVLNVSISWSSSFSTRHAVERYRVSVTPDPSSCSSDQVNPSQAYNCSGLVLGTPYLFHASAISCGGFEGNPNSFSVHPEGPRSPENLVTMIIYSNSSNVILLISWTRINAPPISSTCTADDNINYTLTLREIDSSITISVNATNEGHCQNDTCTKSIELLQSNHQYNLSIHSQNAFGMSEVLYLPLPIAGSAQSYFNFYFISTNSSCKMLGLCSSRQEFDGCSLQYNTDPTYSNLGTPIRGPLNYPFSIPHLNELETYFYQASVIVSNHLSVSVRGSFSCDSESTGLGNHKYLVYQVGFYTACCILGVVVTAILFAFLLLMVKHRKQKNPEPISKLSIDSLECRRSNIERSAVYDYVQDQVNVKNPNSMKTSSNTAYNFLRKK